jgi:hypothetical protein
MECLFSFYCQIQPPILDVNRYKWKVFVIRVNEADESRAKQFGAHAFTSKFNRRFQVMISITVNYLKQILATNKEAPFRIQSFELTDTNGTNVINTELPEELNTEVHELSQNTILALAQHFSDDHDTDINFSKYFERSVEMYDFLEANASVI